MKNNRRDFLKLSAAATVAPMLWIPRRAFAAATPGFGLAKHVLVLHTKGGMRSHDVFNAVGYAPGQAAYAVNPFGKEAAFGTRQWTLGSAAIRTKAGALVPAVTYKDAQNADVTIPDFNTVSQDMTVLGCIDHNPTGSAEVDHRTGSLRMATGDPAGTSGMLALVGRDHPMYQSGGFSTSAVPPVEIVGTEWGFGSGDFANTRPLTIQSAGQSFSADKPIGKGWKIEARASLDARYKATRSRDYRARLDNFLVSKKNAAIFADMLKDPRLNVLDPANAATADAGFTNQQILDILGNYDLMTMGDMQNVQSWGPDVALALRFFGFGAPFAVVTRDMYDMHDNERTNFYPRVNDLARQFQGLHYLLHAMPHPSGGTYWDHTIVVTASEFSRNNTGADGFNSGSGSDHVPNPMNPNRNQAIAIMGGPIAASKGKLIGPTDPAIVALDPAQVFSSKQLLATIVDALGIGVDYFGVNPIAELYQ